MCTYVHVFHLCICMYASVYGFRYIFLIMWCVCVLTQFCNSIENTYIPGTTFNLLILSNIFLVIQLFLIFWSSKQNNFYTTLFWSFLGDISLSSLQQLHDNNFLVAQNFMVSTIHFPPQKWLSLISFKIYSKQQ